MFYLFFANGTEEVEAISVLDVMRRAEIDVKTVGIGSKTVTGSHGLTVECDLTEKEALMCDDLQGIILPGGMPGTINLENSETVQKLMKFCFDSGLFICSICAAPSVPGHAGYLKGKKALCFPGFESDLIGAQIESGFVCRDGNIITGKGMGCALLFGLEIVSAVKGKDFSDSLKKTLQCSI